MRNPIFEIPPERFYKWGFFIFMLMATMNTLSLFQQLYMMRFEFITQILSAFGSLALNYLFAGFFYYLWNSTKPSISDTDFEKQFKEMKGGQDDTTKAKRKSKKRTGN